MDEARPGHPDGVRGEIEHMLEVSSKRLAEGESTWGVRSAVVAATALQVAIPNRYEIPPTWLLPSLGVLLGVALSIVHPRRITRYSPQIRLISISLIAVISVGNAGSGARLIAALMGGREHNPTTLLLTGGAIWLTNVIVFGMWYWELDRGGPAARFQVLEPYPDFLFPQMTAQEALSPPHWRPEFFDYLYLSFTNAAAFSPTPAQPSQRCASRPNSVKPATTTPTAASGTATKRP